MAVHPDTKASSAILPNVHEYLGFLGWQVVPFSQKMLNSMYVQRPLYIGMFHLVFRAHDNSRTRLIRPHRGFNLPIQKRIQNRCQGWCEITPISTLSPYRTTQRNPRGANHTPLIGATSTHCRDSLPQAVQRTIRTEGDTALTLPIPTMARW